jgi:hypothetical protein
MRLATTWSTSTSPSSIATRSCSRDKATIRDPLNGRRRRLKKYDLDNVFNRAARLENGHYRVLVSRFAPGKPLGNFRYYSRRPDDPNDLVDSRAPPRASAARACSVPG